MREAMRRRPRTAKLTLSLHVTGTRADGYHELDATMVSISEPHDVARARARAATTSLTVTGPFADGVPADATNLAWRAADACGATVAIELHKDIPSGAGLGGGSADAAGGARGARRPIRAIAPSLGADVPFCMRGGVARVRGIGDELEPVELPDARGRGRDAAVRLLDGRRVPRVGRARRPAATRSTTSQPAAEHVEPRLVEFQRAVEAAAGAPAILAGSGSSYAVVFDDVADAEQARDRIAAAVDGSVWLAHDRADGVVIDRDRGERANAKRPPRWGGRCLLALLATLPAGLLQKLLVLLLAHALAALLDQ